MNTNSSQAVTDKLSFGKQTEEKKDQYDKRFAELEFRSLRAYLMNYSESGKFDRWARWTENAASTLGVFGISGGAFGILRYRTLTSRWGLLMMVALPASGVMGFAARGMSDVFPTLATRAQNHVDAGAEMTRILRISTFYRDKLQSMPSEALPWEEYDEQYMQLLKDYRKASKRTVIREKAYREFNDVEKICKEYDRRRDQLQVYLDHENKRKEAGQK